LIKDELNEHEAEFSELIKSFIDQLTSEIEDSIGEPDNLQIDDSGKNWTETCAEMYMSNELNIPTLDGESTNWKSYWQQFEAAIHKPTKLTDQLKMQYLQKITRDAIEGIDAKAEGYPEAIEALKARFNCLKGGIQSSSVHLKYSCLSCGKKHHTLLYLDVENRQPISTYVAPPNVPSPNVPPPNVPTTQCTTTQRTTTQRTTTQRTTTQRTTTQRTTTQRTTTQCTTTQCITTKFTSY
jgi:hypothetical protein